MDIGQTITTTIYRAWDGEKYMSFWDGYEYISDYQTENSLKEDVEDHCGKAYLSKTEIHAFKVVEERIK